MFALNPCQSPAPEDVEQRITDVHTDLQAALDLANELINIEKQNIIDTNARVTETEAKTNFLSKTAVNGNVFATGTMIVGNSLGGNAGVNGSGLSTTDVRFWAGSSFANRANAPFRVLDNGEVYATKLHSQKGCEVGNFKITDFGLEYRPFHNSQQGMMMYYDGIHFNELGNTFHRIGTEVLPPSSATKCFSYIQNERKNGYGSIISLGENLNLLPLVSGGLGQYINCPNGTSLYLEAEQGKALEIKKGDIYVRGKKGISGRFGLGGGWWMYVESGIIVDIRNY